MPSDKLITVFMLISTGVEIILFCVPLLLGTVKPNKFYGIRVPEALESEEKWYKVNRYGAGQIILWAVTLIGFGIAAYLAPPQEPLTSLAIFTVAPLGLIAVPLWRIKRYAKSAVMHSQSTGWLLFSHDRQCMIHNDLSGKTVD